MESAVAPDAAPGFDEARRMLILSAPSYRGFDSGLTPRLQAERLHGAVERHQSHHPDWRQAEGLYH